MTNNKGNYRASGLFRTQYFRLEVYERVWTLLAEVYEKVWKSVIAVFEKTLKGKQVQFIAVKDKKTACVSDLIQIHKEVYSQQLKGLTLLSFNYCVKGVFVNKRHAKGV